MFRKADGTDVWLQSSAKLPYLSIAGIIETSEDYTVIRSRLLRFYKLIHGIATDDAFLIHDEDGCALLFCARPDKTCALLLTGEFRKCGMREKSSPVLEELFKMIGRSLSGIARHSRATIRVRLVKAELAISAG